MSRRNRKSLPSEAFPAYIDDLASDGRGVAHLGGKTVFIDGALAGEEVTFIYRSQRKHYDEGTVVEVLDAARERVIPQCAYFGICGGCALQHVDAEAQLRFKQQWVAEQLKRIGSVEPGPAMAPISGPSWSYRGRARLGVRYVDKKDSVLVGFREKRSSYLTDMDRCLVLHPQLGTKLDLMRSVIAGLKLYRRIPQVELAVAEQGVVLVFRHLEVLPEEDIEALRNFGKEQGFIIFLQSGGPETAYPLWPESVHLSYHLPAHNVEIGFMPTDFTQVNSAVNRALVDRVLDMLAPDDSDRVLDLFCGVGNFTLPVARRASSVIGVEGSARLVARARHNAHDNNIGNAQFYCADLSQAVPQGDWYEQRFDKILLDPPRTGAAAIIPHLERWGAPTIVYVSCNPATLARDTHSLVHDSGYRLVSWGVVDMFPQTTHVETIAMFEGAV